MPPMAPRRRIAAVALGAVLAGCTAVLPPALYPTDAGPAGLASVSFRADVAPVLERRCAGCHKPDGTPPALLDAAGRARYDVLRVAIDDVVRTIRDGRMPPGAPTTVTADELATLRAWRAAGAPDN